MAEVEILSCIPHELKQHDMMLARLRALAAIQKPSDPSSSSKRKAIVAESGAAAAAKKKKAGS